MSNVWSGDFFLPFRIVPLGEPSRWIEKRSFSELLPTLRNSEMPWHKTLRFRANEIFLPSALSLSDWHVLIERLVTEDSGMRTGHEVHRLFPGPEFVIRRSSHPREIETPNRSTLDLRSHQTENWFVLAATRY